jgi:sugar phosphate isomerase/epimerase
MMIKNFTLSAFADEIDPLLEKQMDVLDDHGIGHIEMRGVNGKNVTQWELEDIADIKKQLDNRGFSISAVGSPIGKIKITDDFKPHFLLFEKTIKIAHILGTDIIRMFSFYPGDSEASFRDEVMERWYRFTKRAEEEGVDLYHENEKDIFGDTPQRCLDLIKTMDSKNVRAIFDPANFIQCKVKVFPYAFEILKEHIAYIHVKDALESSGRVVPSGYGDGSIPKVLKALKDLGFEGFLSLEPHLGSFSGLKDLELDIDMEDMPEAGESTFKVAVDALKRILSGLEDD